MLCLAGCDGTVLNTNKPHRIVSSFPPLLLMKFFFRLCDDSSGQKYDWVILRRLIINTVKRFLPCCGRNSRAGAIAGL